MSKPPINPSKTAAGIAVDPQTLERVVPESRRVDGSVRKQIKIRPGFTPQEDVSRFRGTKQAQLDANALPKGHIIGWVPPSSATASKPLSKSAKKNAKRKEKRAEKVKDDWEDEEDEDEDEVNQGDGGGEETKIEAVAAKDKEEAKPVTNATTETATTTVSATAAPTKPGPQAKADVPSSSPTPTRTTPRAPRHAGGLAGRLAAELNKLNVSKP